MKVTIELTEEQIDLLTNLIETEYPPPRGSVADALMVVLEDALIDIERAKREARKSGALAECHVCGGRGCGIHTKRG